MSTTEKDRELARWLVERATAADVAAAEKYPHDHDLRTAYRTGVYRFLIDQAAVRLVTGETFVPEPDRVAVLADLAEEAQVPA